MSDDGQSERLAYAPPPQPGMEGWNREGFTCGPPPGLEAFEALFRAPPGLEGLGGLEAFASCSTGQFMPNTFEDVLFGPPGLWPRNEEREERLTCAVAHASRVLRLLDEGGGVQEPPSEVTEEQRGDMTEEQSINIIEEEELGAGEHGGELAAEDRCELVGHSQNLDYAKALDLDGFEGLATVAAVILLRLDDIAGRGDMARRAVREAEVAVRDMLILVCTRNMMIEELCRQGLPDILKVRILAAFQGRIREHIFSDLGTSKYHLFCEGRKFSNRYRKKAKERDGSRTP